VLCARFYLTAWVFLPDHWHGIVAPQYAETISQVIKSVKQSSMTGISRHRGTVGELWHPRSCDRTIRTVEEYQERVEYIHLSPVRAGLVGHPQDWRWSSFNEYAGMRPEEQRHGCGLTIDRVRIPADPGARL
jgi:putative transposase